MDMGFTDSHVCRGATREQSGKREKTNHRTVKTGALETDAPLFDAGDSFEESACRGTTFRISK
jgi:hypothetical protein